MVGVHFTEVEQFLDELDKHADDPKVVVERSIVRATPTYRYAVVATWDLTELERLVLSGRRP